jgi:hypothetical protein
MIVDDVLLRLSAAELAFLRRSLQGPGADTLDALDALDALDDDGRSTEVRLRRRRLVARDDDGRLQIDRVAVALVGTWLRPTTGARVALSTGGPLRTIDLFHLQQMTVEHEQEGDEHVFRPHSSGPALARRLGVLAGLAGPAGQLRPPGERLWLSRATVEALWEAAGQSGAAGVRRVLTREREAVPAPAARSLGAALEEPRRLLRLEVFETRHGEPGAGWGVGPERRSRGGTGAPDSALVSTGGLRLVQEDRGYWAFSYGPGDGGVDVRPVSAAEAGGLLTVLAGAVFRPLPDPASGPAARPGQSES